jgi:hypothetical protein
MQTTPSWPVLAWFRDVVCGRSGYSVSAQSQISWLHRALSSLISSVQAPVRWASQFITSRPRYCLFLGDWLVL